MAIAPAGKSAWTGGARAASWHVLSRHPFSLYFTGSLLSNQGTWLQNTAQMLLAYQLTHSAFAVGIVSCAQFSGFLVLGPSAAALAGRIGSKRTLVGTQLVSGAIAAGLAGLRFSGALTEHWLIAGALATGLAFALALPVQTAMVSRLVPDQDTKAAMAMNSVSYNAGRTLAPVLAVAVLATIGGGWAFALNSLSFVAFSVIVICIHPDEDVQLTRQRHDWGGLRIAVWRPRILLLLAMVAAVTLAEDPVLVLGPALAHQVLAVSSAWPAFFLSALGLGTIAGSLVPTRTAQSHAAAWSLLVLGISMVVFVTSSSALLTVLAALTTGAAGLLTGATAQALLLKSAGPQHATQVMALWAIAWAGSKPIASLVDGWLASNWSVHGAGVLLAAPAVCIALLELYLPAPGKDQLKARAHAFNGRHGYGLREDQAVSVAS
ncbi:MAG: MFS transporter [Streptosporangiaceae bacterium]|jgi:predicted MFS family arabinose efflux permease